MVTNGGVNMFWMLHRLLVPKTTKVCVCFVGTKFGTCLIGKKDEFFNNILFITLLELVVCIDQDILDNQQYDQILSKK